MAPKRKGRQRRSHHYVHREFPINKIEGAEPGPLTSCDDHRSPARNTTAPSVMIAQRATNANAATSSWRITTAPVTRQR